MREKHRLDEFEPDIINFDLTRIILKHICEHGNDLSLLSFKRSWRSCSLSFIHNSRLLEHSVGRHTQNLYDAGLSHMFRDGARLEESVAGLFTVFFVYFTQHTTPRVCIRLSRKQLISVYTFVRHLKRARAEDALLAIKMLRRHDAFTFGMVLRKELKALSCEQHNTKPAGKHVQTIESRGNEALRAPGDVSNSNVHDILLSNARLRRASRAGLDRLRNMCFSKTFSQVCKASEAYHSAWLSLKGANTEDETVGNTSSDKTKRVHEIIGRHLIKYDDKLQSLLQTDSALHARQASQQSIKSIEGIVHG